MPMLLVRIPEDLSYRWHESDKHEDKDLKEFLDFLKKFIESREDADMLRKELKPKGESSNKQNHQKEKEDYRTSKGTCFGCLHIFSFICRVVY